jgi:predicted component of type VI protein secretion system
MLRRAEREDCPLEPALEPTLNLMELMEAARLARGGEVASLSLRVGRDAEDDLRLVSTHAPLLASRCHALLEWQEESGYTVEDLGSTNGTWVNGTRLEAREERRLAAGDTLSFGGPERVSNRGVVISNPFVYKFEEEEPTRGRRPKRRRTEAEAAAALPSAEVARGVVARALGAAMDRGAARVMAAARAPPRASEPPPLALTKEAVLAERRRAAQPLPDQEVSQAMLQSVRAQCACAVCLAVAVAPHATACGHVFCGKCILTWLGGHAECPVCRTTTATAHPVRALDEQLRDIVEPRMPPEEAEDLEVRLLEWEAFRLGREAQREARRAQIQRAVARTNAEMHVEFRRLRGFILLGGGLTGVGASSAAPYDPNPLENA